MPDDESIRNMRQDSLYNLISVLDKCFKLPIIIIAQNWDSSYLQRFKDFKNELIIIHTFSKLGITKARETLRQSFLKTEYDGILCMDDDIEITDNQYKVDKYLKFINKNTNKMIEYENYLMNLLYMPRDIYEKESYDLKVDAESGTGYEDWIYVTVNKNKYRSRYLNTRNICNFGIPLKSRHEMCIENNSTWRTGNDEDQTNISKKEIFRKLGIK